MQKKLLFFSIFLATKSSTNHKYKEYDWRVIVRMQLSDFPLYRQDGCGTGSAGAGGDSGLSALPYFEFTLAFSAVIFLLERVLDRRQIASFRSAKVALHI